ncbi:c-type cytochrome [Zoogloeaceae bacterium G21618-S1]|jgi:cytochrome c553|nr:c-type cytochrome [Zoogloeaceae bacterium G21618-S1]
MVTRLFRSALLALCLPALAFADEPNLDNGREINGTCAACHGENGQGGKHGEYPRIAGQSAKFIAFTLKSFRARERINLPMFPYTQERELPDEDIRDIAAYLSAIELPTRPPKFKETDDALTRLTAMQKVMLIPRVEGDIAAGKTLYESRCTTCHGDDARGKRLVPMLAGQYSNYLMRQMQSFQAGERPHDEEKPGEGVLKGLKESELQNMLAYFTTLQNIEDTQ